MLAYINETDLNAVKVLLGLFGHLPKFVLHGLIALTDRHRLFPDVIGAGLRMINIGTAMKQVCQAQEGNSLLGMHHSLRW